MKKYKCIKPLTLVCLNEDDSEITIPVGSVWNFKISRYPHGELSEANDDEALKDVGSIVVSLRNLYEHFVEVEEDVIFKKPE